MQIEEEEGRYGFGTTIAVDAIIKNLLQARADTQVIIAINLATILRNTISKFVVKEGQIQMESESKGLNVPAALDFTKSTVVDISNEIATICSQRFPDRKHHIVFYLTDPLKQLPPDWIRSQSSESSIRLNTAIATLLRTAKPIDQTNGNVQMHLRFASQMRVPSYKGISELLKEYANYNVPVHLISHMPLDYHIKIYSGRDGFLYRSHTGEVVPLTASALAKVVFKNENLPFYPITHTLFGDRYLVKGTLAKKDRDRFIELATTNHWGLRTSDYIISKVREYNMYPPYTLG
jgi:hypothetical protein